MAKSRETRFSECEILTAGYFPRIWHDLSGLGRLTSSTEKNGRVCHPAHFSLAAGLLGGILSHYAAPVLVHAQTQTAPAKEISAQRFVPVNAAGVSEGEFGIDKDGNASIQLLDKDGRVVWSAGKTKAKPLSASIAK